jgi:hypothetical protein
VITAVILVISQARVALGMIVIPRHSALVISSDLFSPDKPLVSSFSISWRLPLIPRARRVALSSSVSSAMLSFGLNSTPRLINSSMTSAFFVELMGVAICVGLCGQTTEPQCTFRLRV